MLSSFLTIIMFASLHFCCLSTPCSIGYKELSLDGIPKVDDNGNPVLTYNNDKIMSFDRAWTDFPEKMFLKKGTKYQFVGISRDSDMGGKDRWDGQDNAVNILTSSESSQLKGHLLNNASN
eukprot:15341539-Ditylum_brightwellii.AAC.2